MLAISMPWRLVEDLSKVAQNKDLQKGYMNGLVRKVSTLAQIEKD